MLVPPDQLAVAATQRHTARLEDAERVRRVRTARRQAPAPQTQEAVACSRPLAAPAGG